MASDDPHRELERLRSSQDMLGGSAPSLESAKPEDAVELWARRAGRGLAILASVGLVAWALSDLTGWSPR
jgi:ferric-dicitrate binding protein FerR (iron transport regulator)